MRRAIWLLCVVGWVAHEKCAGAAIAGLKGTTAAKLCTIAEALGEACTASRRVSLSLSEAEVRLATRAGLLDAMATVHDMSAQGSERTRGQKNVKWHSAAGLREAARGTQGSVATTKEHKEAVRLAEVKLCGAAVATKEYITTLGSITSTDGGSGVKTCLTTSSRPSAEDTSGQSWASYGDAGRTMHLKKVCPKLFGDPPSVTGDKMAFEATSIGTEDAEITKHSTDNNIANEMSANTECQLLSSVGSGKHGLGITSSQKTMKFAGGLVEITYSGGSDGKMTAEWTTQYNKSTLGAHADAVVQAQTALATLENCNTPWHPMCWQQAHLNDTIAHALRTHISTTRNNTPEAGPEDTQEAAPNADTQPAPRKEGAPTSSNKATEKAATQATSARHEHAAQTTVGKALAALFWHFGVATLAASTSIGE
ncbi:hypothetical protein ERJ75_000100300 [Trypanosoma vivax]|nr:hypothetical protein ERJ75_000100300 [Trypanosoma vivax]